jgi:hypothetical protein
MSPVEFDQPLFLVDPSHNILNHILNLNFMRFEFLLFKFKFKIDV